MPLRSCFLTTSALFAMLFSACAVQVSSKSDTALIREQKELLGIVGGSRAEESDEISKHMVLITVNERLADGRTTIHSGSGVIINNKFIVTAAHIFKNLKIKERREDSGMQAYLNFGTNPRSNIRQEIFSADFLNKNSNEIADPEYYKNPNNADYVFIRIPEGLPPGYSQMKSINRASFIKKGDPVKLAGYGKTNGGVWDYELRTLDLSISATDSSSAVLSPLLGLSVMDLKFFLEMVTTGFKTGMVGDSGGPIFYEIKIDNRIQLGLAGLFTKLTSFDASCGSAAKVKESADCPVSNYGLRIDAFFDDAMTWAQRLIDHPNG